MIHNAKWIACPESAVSPVITKRFTVNKAVSASLDITGLGYFSFTVNGKRVTEDLFTPALTDYEARNYLRFRYPITDFLTHRIYYLSYDITDFLVDGENTLEVRLYPGWFIQNERIAEGETGFTGPLKAVFSLSYVSESGEYTVIDSDGTETYSESDITFSNLFIGEIQDARRRNASLPGGSVFTVPAPESILEKQTCPSDRVIRTISPECIFKGDAFCIYDLGENTSFRLRVKAEGKSGDTVRVRVSENLNADFTPDFVSTGSLCKRRNGLPQIQEDVFVLSGSSDAFTTESTWHAGRYLEVTGNVCEILADVVHTNAPVISAFTCDNETLNWLYDAYLRSQLSNLHSCIPSDCPHRERLGYTGDGQITAKSAMLTLDMKAVYKKWIRDILDCQDIISGHIQHTAPFMGGGGGPGGWGCAVVIVPDEYDRHYNDISLLRECYPAMKSFIGYLKQHSEGNLVMREEDRGWCLGDWAAIAPMRLPEPYVNTCYLYNCLKRLVRIAKRLSCPQDALAYAAYAARVKRALQNKYFDTVTGSFLGGVMGADAYAVWAGITDDERTVKNLAERYEKLGFFDTGFLGTEILADALINNGYADTAFMLLTNENRGSYYHMKAHGATTLWEYMTDAQKDGSHNHPMFGAPVAHLFDGFLGIRQADGSYGYEKLEIAPKIPEKMRFCKGETVLPVGKVSVAWEKTETGVSFKVTLPENVRAEFKYKDSALTLSGGENAFTL